MLAAVRCGEMQPIMLARTIATLDHMLKGRLTVNIISSDFPGEKADSAYRYQRSREVVEILKQAWTQDEINYAGEIYISKGLTTDPAKPYQTGGPLLYFGGYSPGGAGAMRAALRRLPDVARAQGPDSRAHEGRQRGGRKYDRTLDYGLRVHVIVRDTEQEAKEYADTSSPSSTTTGHADPRARARFRSLGVSHQAKNRELADQFGYVEPHLWTGSAARAPAAARRWSARPTRS
jgi:alkanesulfonate monooxygenase